jgi:hypothetical protein
VSAVIRQETLICKHDPNNAGQFLLVLKLDGVSMNIDSGSLMAQTTTALIIDDVAYLPMQSIVSITSTPEGSAVSTTIVVTPR